MEAKNEPGTAASQPAHVHLEKAFSALDEAWQVHVLARANTACVKVMKMQGEYPWHHHIYEDEFFFCAAGEFTMEIEGRDDIEVKAGDVVVVPRGINHRPVIPVEAHVLLVEGNTNSKVFVDPPSS